MGLENLKVGFIGFGKMAQAICQRFIVSKQLTGHQIFFIRKNKEKMHEVAKRLNIMPATTQKIFSTCDIVLFCVKPQNLDEVLAKCETKVKESQLFLSIIAGKKIEVFKKALSEKAQITRVMPNLPSMIGEGVSAICFDKNISFDHQLQTKLLLSSLGKAVEIQEKQMDIATGLSGSGPAFVYKMIDAFAQAGRQGGLSYETALEMAAQTFIGAAQLVAQERDVSKLLEMIATKGGTTQAGLDEFEKQKIEKSLQEVILKAAKRSYELSE